MEAGAVQRRPAKNAIVKERGIDLRLGRWPVEFDVRTAATEEVAAVCGTRGDYVLGQDLCRRESGPAVSRLVETDLCGSGRREAATVHRRGPVACHIRADENVVRIGGVDRNRADRAIRRDRRAAGDERPSATAIGRLVEADAGLRVTRSVRLTGSRVEIAARVEGE